MEDAAIYCCFPHQTGVTERSISGNYGSAADGVLDQMVISHQANRISNGFSLVFNRHHQIGVIYKSGITYFDVGWVWEGIELRRGGTQSRVQIRQLRVRYFCNKVF